MERSSESTTPTGELDECKRRCYSLQLEVELHRKRAYDLQEKLNVGMANYATMKDEGTRLSVVLATLLKSYVAQADILMRSALLSSEQQDQLHISVNKFKMAVGVKEMPTDVSEA